MKKIFLSIWLLFIGLFLNAQSINLSSFASGFTQPIDIAHCGDERMFVVEQGGKIKIIENGNILSTPFLDISSLTTSSGEGGLLGLTFHPDYSNNGFFYIYYTNTSGDSVIARYSVSSTNVNIANSTSSSIILTINQPYSNHNGGCLKFGSDGYLWIAVGDGGSGGDPQNYGQNKDSLLGKILRISVDGDFVPYSIPSDNPFVSGEGSPEIWSYGLRNPWKFSFDGLTNEVWIADVGQDAFEEINKVPSTEAGINFGWRCYEANAPYNNSGCVDSSTMTFPVADYSLEQGRCSITGGYVYRGTEWSDIYGLYFFADFCSGNIGVVNQENELSFIGTYSGNGFSSFGEDIYGNLYIAGRSSGTIFKINGSVASVNNYESHFSIYPNPAKNTIKIIKSNNTSIQKILLYDLSGKLIITQNNQISEINSLDISSVSEGLYILKIIDSNNKTFNYKVKIN